MSYRGGMCKYSEGNDIVKRNMSEINIRYKYYNPPYRI